MIERRNSRYLPTRFKDRLRMPAVLRPAEGGSQVTLRVQMVLRWVRLNSEPPPSNVWTYEGHLPGPTIEARRGQLLRVEPGQSDGRVNEAAVALPPWTVTHLHGGRTAATYDGWTENGALSGQSTVADCANEQRATLCRRHRRCPRRWSPGRQ